MMPRSIILVLAAALAAGAQEKSNLFSAAPPAVEKALRERVTAFYQAYVDGKFRMAEQYVAEDTKDLHYNQEKTKIRGFEIVKINWDDGFKKASVVTTVQTIVQMRGQAIPTAAPMATRWKLENDQWFYYVDPALARPTPMGMMTAGAGSRPQGMKIEDMIKDPGIILNQIKISKEKLLLKSWEKSSDFITVTNGLQGAVTVDFQFEGLAGLTMKIDKKELGAGQTARIDVNYEPADQRAKPTLRATIKVDPINRTIIVPIVFDIPEKLKQQLPKQ